MVVGQHHSHSYKAPFPEGIQTESVVYHQAPTFFYFSSYCGLYSAFSSDWFLAVVFQLRSNWLLHQQSHGTYDSFRILFFWVFSPHGISTT